MIEFIIINNEIKKTKLVDFQRPKQTSNQTTSQMF
jgi:hypothetical protein